LAALERLWAQIGTAHGFVTTSNDLGMGALATAEGRVAFERALAALRARWPESNLAQVLEIQRMSRVGRVLQAAEKLKAVPLPPAPELPMLPGHVVAEVLTRAWVLDLRFPQPGVRDRLHHLGFALLPAFGRVYWAALVTGKAAEAAEHARQALNLDPGHIAWPLCGYWASWIAKDKTEMMRWRKRALCIMGFMNCGRWAIAELDRLPRSVQRN
jgi:hypothetical protein